MTDLLIAEALPSLDSLAEEINREHAAVLEAASDMVAHAILVGHALKCARKQVEPGEWLRWIDANCEFGRTKAGSYMRLASYEEAVSEARSLNAALQLLVDKPWVHRKGWRQPAPWWPAAREMRAQGASYRRIASVIGVNETSVRRAVMSDEERRDLYRRTNESYVRTLQKRARARKALELQEREAAVRAIGGGVSEAYSLVRKAAQVLDSLSRNGESGEIRAAARDALAHLYRCEDEIGIAAKKARSVG